MGFFDSCLNVAWLFIETDAVDFDDRKEFLKRYLGDHKPIETLQDPDSLHNYGLNFSAAWAYWNFYDTTGDLQYLHMFLRNFELGMEHVENALVNEDYSKLHWLPQFGYFALFETVKSYGDIESKTTLE